MEPKMSVGLDASISIGISNQPWGPTSSAQPLKTPTLEPLSVDHPNEWNPAAPSPPINLPLSTGLTPRFSPVIGLVSPGVSGEIAANVPDPSAPSSSVMDLFRCADYPFTPSAPHLPSPPAVSAAPPPASAAPPVSVAPVSSAPIPPTRPTFRPTTTTTPTLPLPPPPPTAHASAYPSASSFLPQTPTLALPLHQPPPVSSAAMTRPSLPPPEPQHPPTYSPPVSSLPAPASIHTYSMSANPNNNPGMRPLPPPPRVGTVPPPMTSVGPPIPQAPVASGAPGLDHGPGATGGSEGSGGGLSDGQNGQQGSGHRSVLGSGIVSSAVQEAQARARLMAETFARDRKRRKVADPVPERAERNTDEDSKLTPDERKKKRYQRRLALNRESAAVSRVRRREYVKLLEEQLVTAEKERVKLAMELDRMQRQHDKLRDQLIKLEGSVTETDA